MGYFHRYMGYLTSGHSGSLDIGVQWKGRCRRVRGRKGGAGAMLDPSAIVVLFIGVVVLYGLLTYFVIIALRSDRGAKREVNNNQG